jgi:hypothetical protein
MANISRGIALAVLAATTLSGAQAKQTFTGTITDDMCAMVGHERMRMGPTDAECVKACILSHDAHYVLLSGSEVYELSDQQTPEKFAALRVRVVGNLDSKTRTIRVESIEPAR